MYDSWIKILMNAALFVTFILLIFHYFGPKKKEDEKQVEAPKYRMLADDDEDRT